jgi:hypothetical protein
MTAKRFCVAGLAFYAGLSLTDFTLTFVIIREGIGYESNPVAEAWLHLHGWKGLAVFKALSALVFGATVAVIARHRPRTAAALVVVGCVALLLVIRHSWQILGEGSPQNEPSPPPGLAPGGKLRPGRIPPRPAPPPDGSTRATAL